MRVVALISGGKDSCFNMMHVVAEGHTIVALANLYPKDDDLDELDSYMYQTVGHEAIDLYSEAMGIPLFRKRITGSPKTLDLNYVPDEDDEVEDLYQLLNKIQNTMEYDAVSSGAILSDYQRIRVESVCTRLGLKSLSYLWQRDQKELLDEMISSDLDAVLIKTAGLGLYPKRHLGKTLAEMKGILFTLNEKYGCHVCGEGGEYETFTLDCPLFKNKIVINESEIIIHSDDFYAPVGYLKLKNLSLEQKSTRENKSFEELPLQTSKTWEHSQLDAISSISIKEIGQLVCVKNGYNFVPLQASPVVTLFSGTKYLIVTNLFGRCMDIISPDEIKSATKKVLTMLCTLLNSHEHDLINICCVQIHVSDMSHYQYINNSYDEFFKTNPPARACIGCLDNSQSNMDGMIFQMSVISCKEGSKKVLHVQGLSHWAPPNIGPFSQCCAIDNIIFISGTIALVPGNIKLIDDGAKSQAMVALDHVYKVVAATTGSEATTTLQAICYVTCTDDIKYGVAAWKHRHNHVNTCSPIYLVVNELPKAAKTEWQGISIKLIEEAKVDMKSTSIESSESAMNESFGFVLTGDAKVYSYNISWAIHNGVSCDLHQCLKNMFEVLSQWMQKYSIQSDDLVQSYLFSCIDNADPVSLSMLWNDISNSSFPVTTANVNMIYDSINYCSICILLIFSCTV